MQSDQSLHHDGLDTVCFERIEVVGTDSREGRWTDRQSSLARTGGAAVGAHQAIAKRQVPVGAVCPYLQGKRVGEGTGAQDPTGTERDVGPMVWQIGYGELLRRGGGRVVIVRAGWEQHHANGADHGGQQREAEMPQVEKIFGQHYG